MKIAIPLAEGKLCLHFGHCDNFALVDVDENNKTITKTEIVDSPPHQPGLLPVWLADKGANMVIAGGMGARAQGLFADKNIQVVVGASVDTPENIVKQYMDGTLSVGQNICDH
jgi:predicted Fe-Mo cluster-binding NifX family protein